MTVPVTHSQHRTAVSWQVHCPICGLNCTRHSCGHQVSFVDDVSQEEVTGAALELFSQAQQRAVLPEYVLERQL